MMERETFVNAKAQIQWTCSLKHFKDFLCPDQSSLHPQLEQEDLFVAGFVSQEANKRTNVMFPASLGTSGQSSLLSTTTSQINSFDVGFLDSMVTTTSYVNETQENDEITSYNSTVCNSRQDASQELEGIGQSTFTALLCGNASNRYLSSTNMIPASLGGGGSIGREAFAGFSRHSFGLDGFQNLRSNNLSCSSSFSEAILETDIHRAFCKKYGDPTANVSIQGIGRAIGCLDDLHRIVKEMQNTAPCDLSESKFKD